MPNQITLKFTGNLAPNDYISARTLAHSLQSVQRAVDKIVIYELRGTLKKHDTLESTQYANADFFIQQLEQGCIQVPLLNEALDYVTSRLRGILVEPYEIAAADHGRLYPSLAEQFPAAYNRALHSDPEVNTQQSLINNPEFERDYYKVAVLKEIGQLTSPLRSKSMTEEESISLRIADNEGARVFTFDKEISTNFNRLVNSKKLGPEVVYTGLLTGLEATNNKNFPFAGKFISNVTETEMKLLIRSEDAARALSPYNLSAEELRFWGAPLTTYGSFDELRGDIVFIEFVE